jgi:transposase
MRRSATVTMTMRDLDRLKVIQAVVDGDLRTGRAGQRLGLTARQVRRLVERYRTEGPIGLVSRQRNRPSNNRLDTAVATEVVRLLRERYDDFGPTLAAEKLRTLHGIDLAKETIRQLQIEAGLWIPRRLRVPMSTDIRN